MKLVCILSIENYAAASDKKFDIRLSESPIQYHEPIAAVAEEY